MGILISIVLYLWYLVLFSQANLGLSVSFYHQWRSVFIYSIVRKTKRYPKSMRIFFCVVKGVINCAVVFCVFHKRLETFVSCPVPSILWEHPKIKNETFSVLAFVSAVLRSAYFNSVTHKIYHV